MTIIGKTPNKTDIVYIVFFNDISQLQEGTYVYDGHNWILQN